MSVEVADLYASLGLRIKENTFKQGEAILEKLKTGLEVFVGYEAVKKIGELVEGTVEAAVQAKTMSQQLGISTDAVQELGYAAKDTGVSTEMLSGGMFRLSRGLEQFKSTGKGGVGDAFGKLGISMSQIKGKGLDANLDVIADKFAKLPDGAKKAALASELFGKAAGPALIPLLNKGSAGIKELREEAEKFGYVIGEEDVKKAKEFEDSQQRVKAMLIGLRNQAVVALLPSLMKLVEGLTEWIKANHEIIKSGIETAVGFLIKVIEGLSFMVNLVIEGFKFMKDHIGIILGALGLLTIVLGENLVAALALWLIGFAPVTAIVLGIAALGLLLKEIADNWDEISDAIKKALDKGIAKIKAFANFIFDIYKRVFKFFYVDIPMAIINAFRDAFDFLKQKAIEVWTALRNAPVLKQLIDMIIFIKEALEGVDYEKIQKKITAGTASEAEKGVGGSFLGQMLGHSVPAPMGIQAGGSVTIGNINVNGANMTNDQVGQAVVDHLNNVHRQAAHDNGVMP